MKPIALHLPESLENLVYGDYELLIRKAAAELRRLEAVNKELTEKLAQQPAPAAQQEPVARIDSEPSWDGALGLYRAEVTLTKKLGQFTDLYTTLQAQRKPLTDEELANILPDDNTPMSLGEAFVKFARAIEAAHGIKENT